MSNYTIVAFCGGGIRGLLSATVLQNLAAKYPQILTGTNLFAGTSTGADTVNMLVGKNPKTPAEIVAYYQGPVVNFYKNPSTTPARPRTAWTRCTSARGACTTATSHSPRSCRKTSS